MAKQAKVISVAFGGSLPSVLSALNLVLSDITSRQSQGQALPGRTIVSMSFNYHPRVGIDKNVRAYMQSLLQSIMNKGAICVCSAGNSAETDGVPTTRYPAPLASTTFPLIVVGAVDITGKIASFSQEGMVYAVGVNSPCAGYGDNSMEDNADGTSGGELLKDN